MMCDGLCEVMLNFGNGKICFEVLVNGKLLVIDVCFVLINGKKLDGLLFMVNFGIVVLEDGYDSDYNDGIVVF